MVNSVKKDAKGVTVTFKDKDGKSQTLQAEKLLLAVGRKPMTENCGLEKSKAKVERGAVQVGPYMETAERACTPSATSFSACRCWPTPP